jgi:hypothetical protein
VKHKGGRETNEDKTIKRKLFQKRENIKGLVFYTKWKYTN